MVDDSRGHQAGDLLLAQASTAWQACLPPEALVARYGGEEFGVLLPGADVETASGVLQRLRWVVPEEQTLWAGLATWDGREEPAALVARADAAMYQAKRDGHDRVSIAAMGSRCRRPAAASRRPPRSRA